MIDLNFQVVSAEPERVAAVPSLRFSLRVAERVTEGRSSMPIHSVVLRCQIQIEPGRRRYSAGEQARLLDLFGTPERWGQTVHPMLWALTSVVVRPFTGTTELDLPVSCSYDFNLAATRYFDALEEGDIPLCFLFSGTIFYQIGDGFLQVAQIPWDKEAYFRLPAATWKSLMQMYYPNLAWLGLRKDAFDRLNAYRSRHGLASWEQTLDALLAMDKESPTS